MKQWYKYLITICMATVMAFTMIHSAAAQEVEHEEPSVAFVSIEDGGEKAYDLVWKYKKENGHYYKRRWNRTLNIWYDPAWILVQ